ncbi:MAG: hypothetical protein ACM31C_01060, partial [Acidobacteriota bacterium]
GTMADIFDYIVGNQITTVPLAGAPMAIRSASVLAGSVQLVAIEPYSSGMPTVTLQPMNPMATGTAGPPVVVAASDPQLAFDGTHVGLLEITTGFHLLAPDGTPADAPIPLQVVNYAYGAEAIAGLPGNGFAIVWIEQQSTIWKLRAAHVMP